MMQMMGQEDSETGSVTDSGRGPSEEGDTRPSPVDPATGEERGTSLNPLRAKFFREIINIYLHFMSSLHIDMTQVLKMLPHVRPGPTYTT